MGMYLLLEMIYDRTHLT